MYIFGAVEKMNYAFAHGYHDLVRRLRRQRAGGTGRVSETIEYDGKKYTTADTSTPEFLLARASVFCAGRHAEQSAFCCGLVVVWADALQPADLEFQEAAVRVVPTGGSPRNADFQWDNNYRGFSSTP